MITASVPWSPTEKPYRHVPQRQTGTESVDRQHCPQLLLLFWKPLSFAPLFTKSCLEGPTGPLVCGGQTFLASAVSHNS